MAVTQQKVEKALEDVKVLCVTREHENQNDGWIVEGIKEENLTLRSLRYGIYVNIPYAYLQDRKKPELLKDEIFKLFTFFAKGLEYGVLITKDKVGEHLGELFAPPQVKEPLDVPQPEQ